MNKNSNLYQILYSAIMVVLVGTTTLPTTSASRFSAPSTSPPRPTSN